MSDSRIRSILGGVCLVAAVLMASPLLASNEGYYQQPAIHGDTVVFVSEGDLWTVGVNGGLARRLTSHLDEESEPSIHPDGRSLAFSARYEGSTEVYTMPIDGGLPSRWTWEEDASVVVGWSHDGALIYRTSALSTLPTPLLVQIDLEQETRSPLPLFEASDGSHASDGTLFFARPGWQANNTKRYKGGTARNLWRFGTGDAEAVKLTGDFDGENSDPMAWNGRVFFLNDRDGTMNVWSMDHSGGDLRQHTKHSGWDVKGPSVGPHGEAGAVVYQLGADLWKLDLATDQSHRIDVRLASDFDQLRDRWVDRPLQSMTDASLSPNGDRVVVTTRGRVFVLPAKAGRRVQIAPHSGVRYRSATFNADGDNVLLLSDETGEQEYYSMPANGVGDAEQITDGSEILSYDGVPSPDDRYLAYTDRGNDLWVVDREDGSKRKVNDLKEGVGDVVWSADSRWLVWERRALNSYVQLQLSDVKGAGAAFSPGVALTSDRTNSFSPVFSADGKWLFFLSDRHLRSLVGSPWGARQPEPYFDTSIKLYQIALTAGQRPTFLAPDELIETKDESGRDSDGKAPDQKDDAETQVPEIAIDLDGIAERVWGLPVKPGNYRSLAADSKHLYFVARGSGPDPDNALKGIKLDVEGLENGQAKVETVAANVQGFEVSRDRSKMLLVQSGSLAVIDTGLRTVKDLAKHRVPTTGFRFPITVREDFRQIFIDAWRLERDFFYDPAMHGVDWEGVRDKYLPLVDRVSTRRELSDLIGEVVGELSALHVSVRGGDLRETNDNLTIPTLGARVTRDPARRGFVIDHIYQTDPDYPDWRGPLADPYLKIQAGDVIVAVNGQPTIAKRQLGALLRGHQNQQVLLTLANASGAERQVVVTPTTRGRDIRYQDWEVSRRLEAEQRSGDQLGYVHLRAMGSRNLSEWYRNFYPVFDRPGLIIDVRHNRGGNIDSIILEKLLRQAWFFFAPRDGEPTWNMQYAFRGHIAVLVNSNTASDGEAFAEGFRRLGLGKVIGKRTWGGEIWLSSNNRLSDGGIARAPQTGVYADGEWLIEGWGVDPDIEVDNLPVETFEGRDRQLETAIEHLLRLIEEDPRSVPEPPAYPDKSFTYPEN